MIPVGDGDTHAPDSPRFLIFAIFMDLLGELEIDIEYLAVHTNLERWREPGNLFFSSFFNIFIRRPPLSLS